VRILVSWLRELVEVPVPVKDLAWDLNMVGFEVAGIEPVPWGDAGDAVVDFEITANRPDCLSLAGLAREVSTRYGTALHLPAPPPLEGDPAQLPVRVTIDDAARCPRYAAAVADVAVGPSPAWLTRRLEASGVRAINNVVDATNYVLLELGHPLHAFDLARLAGAELRIRCARPGERMTTLDGQRRDLASDMLVIADAACAQAVAGVMGGHDSEVTGATRTIVLESAYFQPASVRRTSKRLGLSSEASYRFERGADPEAPPRALARVCGLLEQIGAGRVRPGAVDLYPAPRPRARLVLSLERLAAILGRAVPVDDASRILRGLGFVVEPVRDAAEPALEVTVPSWRNDVARDVDLVEDIARHDGYDRLPTTFPVLSTAPPAPDARLERDRAAMRLAARAGFAEAVTFTFIEREAAAAFAAAERLVAIANPLSATFAVLRPSLLPGLVDAVGHNRRRERRDVRLFETGARFATDTGETRGLGLVWTGTGSDDHWSGTGRPVDLFDMKGAVEAIGAGLGLELAFGPTSCDHLVPGRAAAVTAVGPDGREVAFGVLGQLAGAVAAAHGLPATEEIYVAELDLDAVASLVSLGETLTVRPLPRHPSVVRDLSVVVDDGLPAAALRATIRRAAPPTLVRVWEFARYHGTGVPEGLVSLSFRLTFRDPDRTLTDGEVQAAVAGILAALVEAHGARLR